MIYFDMTSCLDYMGRNPLGIVRVEMKLVQYALSHMNPEQITFCYYDRTFHKISYLAFSDAQGVLSQIGRPVAQSGTAAVASGSSQSNPVQIKKDLRTFLKSIRDSLRMFFANSPAVLRILAKCESIYKLKNGSSQATPRDAMPNYSEDDMGIEWGKGDIFVTVGLIWDYLPLEKIYSEKKKRGFKVVGMIYDLIPYKVPEYCQGVPPSFFTAVANLIWCADAIATISKQTQKDVVEFIEKYHLPMPALMDVTYLGMDVGVLQEGYVPDQSEIDVSKLESGRFILQVGTMEPRKNHALTCMVWRVLAKENFPEMMPIVIVGAPAWGVSDILEMTRRDKRVTPKYLIHSNRVSDQTLLWLYRNCLMTVYPSFYEGWGLPISESLVHGRFCLTGDNGALKEASGGFAESISPYDTISWVNRLRECMRKPESVKEVNQKIAAEYHGRTWDDCGRDFFSFVEEVRGVKK